MSEELWKPIKDFPRYEVSNYGRVRNIEKNIQLALCIDKSIGYRVVNLYGLDHKPHRKMVHRLVGEAFIPNPENKRTINHIDCNKTNNHVSNLEWATDSEQMRHAFDNGLCENTRAAAYEQVKRMQEIQRIERQKKNRKTDFLYPFQLEAVNKMFNGCVLNGSVGSGKSRTGLFYYFKNCGGWIDGSDYTRMTKPKDLLIITTAKKRNDCEWLKELSYFRMYPDPELNMYSNNIIIDSWQNIKKYTDLENYFVIFDEDYLTGGGAWVKAFYKIAKKNEWIILSATAGDKYEHFIPVFVANGFYKNKTEFVQEHVVYARYTNYPKVERYLNTQKLDRLREKILIEMKFNRHTTPHHEDIYTKYDIHTYKEAIKRRWDIFKDEPIQQASGLCYVLRRIVNTSEDRQMRLLELLEDHPKAIIFYNFDHERDILLNLCYTEETKVAEWSGHAHDPVPTGDKWVYLVNYAAGDAGWNCITTDTIIFYSQNYSYKTMVQASGRIDRLNTPFTDLYYYHLKSRSGIDLAISKALTEKKQFNETRWTSRMKLLDGGSGNRFDSDTRRAA